MGGIREFRYVWAREVLRRPEEFPMLSHFERARIARARRGETVFVEE